jgi:hypothetical protein
LRPGETWKTRRNEAGLTGGYGGEDKVFCAVKPGTVTLYADRCLLSPALMARHGIFFKKMPRDTTRF